MNAEYRTGEVLLGKYRVDGIVGQGGMGFIVRALHLQLGESVALKFLRREILDSPESVNRFMREARAAIRIKSEHVARVIDVNTLETGEPFIVMEYLNGESLGNWAEKHGPLPIQTVVEFTLQICEAIAEAHGLGIVHRDLKPANIFVTRRADGIFAAKVLDFGISKVSDPVSATATTDKITKDIAMGSPAYCSPEQLQTPEAVDSRADLWSLGVVLYELLTGALPFRADNTLQLCVKVLHERFAPLQSHRPELPEGLCQAIERCLKKAREDRFDNVGELALALLPYAPQRAKPSVERIIRTVSAANGNFSDVVLEEPTSEQTNPPHVVDQLSATRRTSSSSAILLALTFVGLAAFGGFALAQRLARSAVTEAPTVFVIENAVQTALQARSKADIAEDLRTASSAASSIVIQLPVTTSEPAPQAMNSSVGLRAPTTAVRKTRTRTSKDDSKPETPPTAPRESPNVFETRD